MMRVLGRRREAWRSVTSMKISRIFRSVRTAEQVAQLQRNCQTMIAEVKDLREQVARLTTREGQLRAVLTRDAQLQRYQAQLKKVLAHPDTPSYIAAAIAGAKLHRRPFPYAVVDRVLPTHLYKALLRGLPPVELFGDRPVNKQQLTIPFALAPAYSQRVWHHFVSAVVPECVVPALLAAFRGVLDDWIATNWPDVPAASVALGSSEGRILLRRRGYQIPPHRDPKWAFLTGILYLARRGDSEQWGTQLYTVADDEEAPGTAPHWIDPSRCTTVKEIAFRPNRLLVFLNSVGAHGANIPADAQPESLERYIYQFRIGPALESMALLKSHLPEHRRSYWAGKAADY